MPRVKIFYTDSVNIDDESQFSLIAGDKTDWEEISDGGLQVSQEEPIPDWRSHHHETSYHRR